MQSVTVHTGRAVVLGRSDVDTDQIIPAEYCKRLGKSGYADTLFAHWRTDPGFVLNTPAAAGATVLIGSHNFGTGSSREHAVWALRDWGFAAVLATGFGDIFLRNAWKNGFLAVVLPADAISWLAARAEADPEFRVSVDLEACEVRAGGRTWPFPVDARARALLLAGRDEISEALDKESEIAAHEAGRAPWLPRLRRGMVSGTVSSGAVPASEALPVTEPGSAVGDVVPPGAAPASEPGSESEPESTAGRAPESSPTSASIGVAP
ncbi:MAG: 3-isopropylmalate dehydratase small subunit [Catenulispora sp.]|nr:3-isopropylmalate dehydratase small subunit [Catenulispora sp.]